MNGGHGIGFYFFWMVVIAALMSCPWNKWISQKLNHSKLKGRHKHINNIHASKAIIKKVKQIVKEERGEAKALMYLKKIDPYVFEELVLTCIENQNVRVQRNKSYSGDGGWDGAFKLKKGQIAVQCKRYNNFINPEDVKDFHHLVAQSKFVHGIFVHTGKTGDDAKEMFKSTRGITLISGGNLIKMITGKLEIRDKLAPYAA